MVKLSDERFEEAKKIMENNIKEMKEENKNWRNGIEKYLGKKKKNDDDIIEEKEINKNIDIDEKREENEKNKIQEREKMKLKLIIENLRTENYLLKYQLLNINDNKNKNNPNEKMKIEEEINNEQKDKENINNLEQLINKNKEQEEMIKKLQEEINNLKLNIISKNEDLSSPYNFLINQLQSLSKDKFIFFPSSKVCPVAFVFPTLSLPARSTKFNFPLFILSFPSLPFSSISKYTVNKLWDLEL